MFIPPISPQSPSPIIRGWNNRPVVAAVPKVPPRKLKKKKKIGLGISSAPSQKLTDEYLWNFVFVVPIGSGLPTLHFTRRSNKMLPLLQKAANRKKN
jgi:hypothetical protein